MVLKGQEVEENNKFVPLNRTLADRYFEKLRPLTVSRIVASEGVPESILGVDGGFEISERWLDLVVWTPLWDNRFGWWLARIGIRCRRKDMTLRRMFDEKGR